MSVSRRYPVGIAAVADTGGLTGVRCDRVARCGNGVARGVPFCVADLWLVVRDATAASSLKRIRDFFAWGVSDHVLRPVSPPVSRCLIRRLAVTVIIGMIAHQPSQRELADTTTFITFKILGNKEHRGCFFPKSNALVASWAFH